MPTEAVGGAVNTTGETARAALQCIGPATACDTVSGVFFMCVQDAEFGHDGVLAFADCALVVDPAAEEIAEIAIATAGSVRAVMGAEAESRAAVVFDEGQREARPVDKMIEALRDLARTRAGAQGRRRIAGRRRAGSCHRRSRKPPDRPSRAAPTR